MLNQASFYGKRLEQFLDRYQVKSRNEDSYDSFLPQLLWISLGIKPTDQSVDFPNSFIKHMRDHFDAITENAVDKSPQEL